MTALVPGATVCRKCGRDTLTDDRPTMRYETPRGPRFQHRGEC